MMEWMTVLMIAVGFLYLARYQNIKQKFIKENNWHWKESKRYANFFLVGAILCFASAVFFLL